MGESYLLRAVRLRRQRRPVRVAERAGVPGVRVRDPELVLLAEGLRAAAGAVRARAVQRRGRVVVQSREGAPRPALVLVLLLPAPGDLPGERRRGPESRERSTDGDGQHRLLHDGPPM